jgi:glycosyltransferase involved in cell wall biosynthesis
MACGVPVVATDAAGGGPRNVLDGGKYGILVPNNDVNALAEGILKVLSSNELREKLIAAGRSRCESFKPEVIAQKWLGFLKKML